MSGFDGMLADAIERINGAWWILDLALIAFFIYYFFGEYQESKLSYRSLLFSWWDGRMPLKIQAAAAILFFHVGDLGVRLPVWYLRHLVNNSGITKTIEVWSTPVIAFFALVAGIGMLCQIRVFAGVYVGRWTWLTAGAVALAMAAVTTMLP